MKASGVVLRTIGESPIVARAIESLFGTASAEALRLSALPAEARGLAVIENDQLAQAILGAKELSEADRLTWAGAVNTLRSHASFQPLFVLGNPRSGADLAEALAANRKEVTKVVPVTPDTVSPRTWSISPSGDITATPAIKVPIFTGAANQLEIKVQTIQAGKIGAGAVACYEMSCIATMQNVLSRFLHDPGASNSGQKEAR